MKTKGVTVKQNKLFTIHYKGELLATYVWPSSRSGYNEWKPSKKVYFTVGTARSGISHLPDEIREHCEIVEYGPISVVEKVTKFDKLISKAKADLKKATRYANMYARWREDAYKAERYEQAAEYEKTSIEQHERSVALKNEIDRLTAQKKALP